ncbi:MAG: serine/threonine protein kinase [Planctomycetaceae bacterium]|jgi:serine/threonine protein kinase|nr:serine/threonine protein kinase [Planctomycetaceae bacterium]
MSVAQFLDILRRSGLAEPAELDKALADIQRKATPEQFSDAKYIADELVKRCLITVWHTHQLFKGRYRGYFLRQYKILGHIGSGGMSTVYLAEHTLMQRRVAVKVLPKSRLGKSIYLERFIREAQAIASLDHPNIIRAYDIDREEDVHYIVMEYFPAEDLQHLVDKEKKVPFPRIVNLLRQAADALAHAHEIGVIHRDVKPSNILVNAQGTAKILDLGLALLDENLYEGRITMIQEDTILGTADYLAPEQALDSHKVDARADIYSLGCVLYFCLTGHPPFPAGTVSQRLLAHQQKEPVSVLIDRPDTPDDLANLCRKMMSKRPEDRQQSAADVAREMEDWLIEHGYAEANEFDLPAHQFPAPLGDLGMENHFANQGKLVQLMQQVDARKLQQSGSEQAANDLDNVNLLDTAHGSSLYERSGGSSHQSRGGEYDDPLLHALNEVERERTKQRKEQGLGVRGEKREVRGEKKRIENGEWRAENDISVNQNDSPSSISQWYRFVPVWFWTLFFSVFAAAIFFAGLLVMLLFLVFATSPE